MKNEELILKYTEAFKNAFKKAVVDLSEEMEIKISDGTVEVFVPDELRPIMALISEEIKKIYPDLGLPQSIH
jgi:hypothetical protein